MATKAVVKAAVVTLDGDSFNDQIRGLTLSVTGNEVDVSNFESEGWTEFEVGMLTAKLTLELVKNADFSTLDAAMWGALGTKIPFTAKLSSGATSAANPIYSGTACVSNWKPLSGSVGQAVTDSPTFTVSGKITRATS